MISRIALGTVQFGLPYGVANKAGQVSRDEAALIVSEARAAGVDTIDTAVVYGESEQVLGEIGVGQWRVISKLPPVPEDHTVGIEAWVMESVHASLRRLGIPRLHGLLVHQPLQLLGPCGDAIYRAMTELKKRGQVEKMGVSVYGPGELDALCARFEFDIVQAPFSIVDRRLARSGWLRRLRASRTEIHTRSAFLQGLLLMDDSCRPPEFGKWQPLWRQWHHWLVDKTLTPLQACLGFVLSQPEIDRVVVGVDGAVQLREILASVDKPVPPPPDCLMSEDPDLINPSLWKTA